jgi:L-threonylcarbamoyladenylate synthase
MSNFDEFVKTIKAGGTVLYLSDTIWGLGCDPSNEAAVQKIIQLKNSPEKKSFIVLTDHFRFLERMVPEFPEVCYDLVDFSADPLTIIYPNAKGLAKQVLAEDGSVGIRITKDPYCISYLKALNGPLLSTSANFSGDPFPKSFEEIHPSIIKGVDYILQSKDRKSNPKPSKIIKIGLDSSIEIIRG